MVLVPRRAVEGGRQSGKGWRYLRWTFRMRVFSMKKEECEGFDPSTHSFTHSLLHSFTPIHSFGYWLMQSFTCSPTEPTELEDGRIGENWEENSLVRTRCRCVHVTLRQTRMLQWFQNFFSIMKTLNMNLKGFQYIRQVKQRSAQMRDCVQVWVPLRVYVSGCVHSWIPVGHKSLFAGLHFIY